MPQASQSLKHRNSPLAEGTHQLQILNSRMPERSFSDSLEEYGLHGLTAQDVEVMQVNVGKLCNMTCRHCHVDAGPDRREIMTWETIELCLEAIRNSRIRTLDLTGGAPEMNPHFREFVREARRMDVHVIDRCNLTILLASGFEDLPEFLAEHDVEIVASLPCYLKENTDRQRGAGAYDQSLQALERLNRLGYGRADDDTHQLTLVYNPGGPQLPPPQKDLEAQYRQHLRREYGIEFDRLFTITNMPISRFLEDLIDSGKYETYMQTLIEAFNPAALQDVMCRKMISVGWDGQLYDCDFNQMLEIPTASSAHRHIRDFNAETLSGRPIMTGAHCFGCTAGNGSGCHGSLVDDE